MELPVMSPIGLEENIGDAPVKLNEFVRQVSVYLDARLGHLNEATLIQAEINKEVVHVAQELQKRMDDRYDRLDARILSILKRLDKLEGKH